MEKEESAGVASNGGEQDLAMTIRVWEQVVATQMHFNEMSVKSRQIGLAFVTAILGVAAVALTNFSEAFIDVYIDFDRFKLSFKLHTALLLVGAAILGVKSVEVLDLNVYHKMLRGAVTFGEGLEREHLNKTIFRSELGMTQAISHFSRYKDAEVEVNDGLPNRYLGCLKSTANDKIKGFYNRLTLSLVFATIVVFIVTGDISYNAA